MSDLSPPSLHPTIVVGCGDHGRDCLRHLLSSTATRGVLQWEAVRDGGGAHERQLRRLRLVHLPHSFEEDTHSVQARDEDNVDLELMKDLYRQIRTVRTAGDEDVAQALARALDEEATSLLKVGQAGGGGGGEPLGLDVIVIVHPQDEVVLGSLTNTLKVGMETLATRNNLVGRAAGADRLSFVQVLDFDHYWAPGQRGLRQAVRNTLLTWEQRAQQGRPAFGRTWLLDGHPDQAEVPRPQRIDQLVLFLEFLLFEEQRTVRQGLFQRGSMDRSAIGTFGVHMLERSSGLLRRLAAAIFGARWLDHLVSEAAPADLPRSEGLAARMAAWSPEALDALVGREELQGRVADSMGALRQRLAAMPVHGEHWPADVHAAAEEHVAGLRHELEATARARLRELDAESVGRMRTALRRNLDEMLHHRDRPVALGRVIHELEALLEQTRGPVGAVSGSAAVALREPPELRVLHQAWREWTHRQLDVGRTPMAWALLAVLLTAVAAPLLSGFLAGFGLGPTPSALSRSLAALSNPLLTHGLLLAPALVLGAWGQRQLSRRLSRERDEWLEAHQGRFAGALRRATSPEGEWGGPVQALLEERLADLKAAVRAAVCRELEEALDQLKERRREAEWLRSQLRSLLQRYRLDPDRDYLERHGAHGAHGAHGGPQHREAAPLELQLSRGHFRQALEQASELLTILERNGPSLPRFRSTQHSRRPFAGWEQRFCPTFLYPFGFLDELSREYRDPQQDDADQAHEGPLAEAARLRIREFVHARGRPDAAFDLAWTRSPAQGEHLALFPATWLLMEGVKQDLLEAGFDEAQVVTGRDPERGYLLFHRLGLAPDDLDPPEAAPRRLRQGGEP